MGFCRIQFLYVIPYIRYESTYVFQDYGLLRGLDAEGLIAPCVIRGHERIGLICLARCRLRRLNRLRLVCSGFLLNMFSVFARATLTVFGYLFVVVVFFCFLVVLLVPMQVTDWKDWSSR